MNFVGTGLRLTGGDIVAIAGTIGCEPAAIDAVLAVETSGRGFDDRNRLALLPEGAIFYREIRDPEALKKAVANELAWEKWGALPYDNSQTRRYARLARMMDVDHRAALESCSWGIGQTMGFNYALCGFANAWSMIESYLEGEAAQLRGTIGFIISSGLQRALVEKDWASFARGYNGPGYKTNSYDTKLARAYKQAAANHGIEIDPLADGVLSIGDRGQEVMTLQRALLSQGFDPGGQDGAFGKLTAQTVAAWQRAHGLNPDGVVGRKTGAALGLKWAA